MTKAFLIVSVACDVWFLFLLFYDRIMDTKLIRFFRHIAGLWRSLDSTVAAVSYTHLDVYKRQLKSYPNGVCRIIYILDKKAR